MNILIGSTHEFNKVRCIKCNFSEGYEKPNCRTEKKSIFRITYSIIFNVTWAIIWILNVTAIFHWINIIEFVRQIFLTSCFFSDQFFNNGSTQELTLIFCSWLSNIRKEICHIFRASRTHCCSFYLVQGCLRMVLVLVLINWTALEIFWAQLLFEETDK